MSSPKRIIKLFSNINVTVERNQYEKKDSITLLLLLSTDLGSKRIFWSLVTGEMLSKRIL